MPSVPGGERRASAPHLRAQRLRHWSVVTTSMVVCLDVLTVLLPSVKTSDGPRLAFRVPPHLDYPGRLDVTLP